MNIDIYSNKNIWLTPLVIGCVLVIMFLPNSISIYEPRSVGESPNLLPAWHYATYGLSLQVAEETMHIPHNVFANLKVMPFQLARLCKGCGDVLRETKYGYKLSDVLQSMGITFSKVKENPYIWFIGADGYTQIRDYSTATSWEDVDDVVSVTASNLPKKADKYNTPIGFFNTDEFAHDDVKDGTSIALKDHGFEGVFFTTPNKELPELIFLEKVKPEYDEHSFELKVFVNGVEQESVSLAEFLQNSYEIEDSKDGKMPFVPLDYFTEKYNTKNTEYLELFAYDSYAWHPMERLNHDDVGFVLNENTAEEFGSPINFYVPRDSNYPIGKAGILKGNLKIVFTG